MGRVAQFGVYVEILGTFGIAVILAIHGFHHGLGFLFTTQHVQHVASNPLGLNFHGHWLLGAALVSVLAPVYIYYGFESAGDIAEETKDAGRQIPRAMRLALIWGGIASFVLTAALLLSMPKVDPVSGNGQGRRRAVPARPALERHAGLPARADHLRVLLVRHLDPGRRQPPRLLVRTRRRAAGLGVDLRRSTSASGRR